MFLPLFAAILHAIAYALYMFYIFGGEATPNSASWTVWALLATLNAVTFWKTSKSALATAQFFTGSFASILVWGYALFFGHFSQPSPFEWIIITMCIAVIIVWKISGKATYASLIVAVILIVSFIPTITSVWQQPADENALPWIIWTVAFVATISNCIQRRGKKSEIDWRFTLVVPSVGMITHAFVAILAY